ncbi:MAG: helix-turn-helix domain-containing protein [Acidobacteria bacterium]|nr:helix-turn-helix domain-containing protein [Acidobacteriota bacterium]
MPGVKAYKFKLKTNPAFEQACVFTLDTCRELYNASLQERRDAYQINHVSLNYNSQSAQLPVVFAVECNQSRFIPKTGKAAGIDLG